MLGVDLVGANRQRSPYEQHQRRNSRQRCGHEWVFLATAVREAYRVLWQKAVTFLSRQLKCATNKRSPTHNYRVNLDRVGYSLLCCVVLCCGFSALARSAYSLLVGRSPK